MGSVYCQVLQYISDVSEVVYKHYFLELHSLKWHWGIGLQLGLSLRMSSKTMVGFLEINL